MKSRPQAERTEYKRNRQEESGSCKNPEYLKFKEKV